MPELSLFQAVNVSKRFANHTALNKVSIDVPLHSIFGLLGPNGAGKTTLIRIINMITGPDEGQLFFKGAALHPSHISSIGYLPEERGLYKKMKVGEQAIYLARLKGLNRQDAIKQLKYWFEKFDITEWWNRKVEELSKGMQQKVQFIVTVLHKPELLIFDEPFSGFDPINVNIIKEEILNLQKQGTTLIFSTHNMSSVEELCDNIALINRSEKVLEGKVRDIKMNYKTNTFELQLSDYHPGILNFPDNDIQLLESREEEGIMDIHVRLSDGISSNHLLKTLIPHATIRYMKEITPTMNEIFIRTVAESESLAETNVNKL